MKSEHERREKDIDEMGEHYLKKLVMACLQNDSESRPEVKEIKDVLGEHERRLVQQCNHCGSNGIQIERVEHLSSMRSYDYTFSLLFIGDTAVGKSCLFNRFVNPAYDVSMSIPTMSIDMRQLSFKYGSKYLHLEIFDTAGQEKYFSIPAIYFRRVNGIFLVYDVTDRESFEHVPKWLEIVQKYCTEENLVIILIGNKTDQGDNRQVSSDEGHSRARRHGLSFVEGSALNEESIEQMLLRMIQSLTYVKDRELIKIELPKLTDTVKLEKPPKRSRCNKC